MWESNCHVASCSDYCPRTSEQQSFSRHSFSLFVVPSLYPLHTHTHTQYTALHQLYNTLSLAAMAIRAMDQASHSTANDLCSVQGSIAFVFDTCALIDENHSHDMLDAITQLLKGNSRDFGILPQDVAQELNGLREDMEEGETVYEALKSARLTTVNEQFNGKGRGSSVRRRFATQDAGAKWGPMVRFTRNNDDHILSCVCYYAGFGAQGTRERSDVQQPILKGIQKVVLVTQDQILTLKGTAIYRLPVINARDFIRVFFRES